MILPCVESSSWKASDVYSEDGTADIEIESIQAELKDYEIANLDKVEFWLNENDEAPTFIAKFIIYFTVDLDVECSINTYDGIDNDYVFIGSKYLNMVDEKREIEIFLNCHSDIETLRHEEPKEWEVEFEINHGDYDVEVGSISPYFDKH